MPIAPDIQQPISLDVPGAQINPGAAGAVGEAAARLGQQVMGTSLSLLEQVKTSEAKDAAAKAYYDDFLASEDYSRKLKLQSPDGYITDEQGKRKTNADGTPRTISQEYRDWANDRFTKTQESMPSRIAQDLYKERSGEFFSKQIASAYTDEQSLKVQAYEAQSALNVQRLSDNLVSAPEVNKAYSLSNALSEDQMNQVGTIHSKPVAEAKIQKQNQQLAESTFKGGYNQVLSSTGKNDPNRSKAVSYWRAVLKGEDYSSKERKRLGLPSLSDMLDPDKKAAIELEFIHLADKAKELDLSDFHAQVSEAEASLKAGKGGRVNVPALLALKAQFVGEKKLSPFEGAQIDARLAAAQGIGTMTTGSFYMASPAERLKIAEDRASQAYRAGQRAIGPTNDKMTVGSVSEAEVKKEFLQENTKALSAEQDDFAAYMAGTHPGVAWGHPGVKAVMAQLDFTKPTELGNKAGAIQSALREMDSVYRDHFPSQPQYWRVITKDQAKTLSETLMNPAVSTQATALGIKSLAQAYGDRYPEVMDQLIRDGHLHEGWRFAATMPNYLATEDVIGALKGRNEAFEKNFKTVAESRGVKEQDFDTAVSQQVGPFVAALSQQSPNDVYQANKVNAMSEVVKIKAMQRYVQTGGVLSPAEAAKQAAESLIHRNVYLEEVGGGLFGKGQKSIMVIPKQIGSTPIGELERDQIVKFSETSVEPGKLKALGIVPPPQRDGSPTQFEDKFYEQAADTGRFTMAKSQRGLNFWYFDRQANKDVQAFTLDKKGRPTPLLVPIETALKPTPETQKKGAVKPPVFSIPGTPVDKQ
jgi:hypothetical protein